MTDNTQPEALDLAAWLEAVGGGPSAKRCAALLREQHARIAELEAQLEAVGAGGVSGPLMGIASLAANAGEPVAWMTFTEEGDPDMVFLDRLEACQYCEDDDPPKPLYLAAPPTAQAEGWRPIENAPKGELVLLWSEITRGEPFIGDWAEYARYNHPQFTHWSRWDGLPPTSAEGVEHG